MRLLMVSNRLPITVTEENGQWSFQRSVGGLSSGLSAYLEAVRYSGPSPFSEFLWIGWPGATISPDRQEELSRKAHAEGLSPVYLSEEDMENFYHGFCNKTIWALFHYFPSYAVYKEDYWEHYKKVNEIFCEAVLKVIRQGDVLWIHDYHLMLLPLMIKQQRPEIPVGFFLHIPFPNYEIFRLLPNHWRQEILEGLLGSDLVGFHTHDYAQYFLRCVHRILGHEHHMGEILLPERGVKVDTFPMGINFKKFQEMAASPQVQQEVEKARRTLGPVRIVLSIDRLDYSKGILNRLLGYERFLEKNPEWHENVVLLLVVVPSRIGVEHYQIMKKEIDENVGRINGKFGILNWVPILYQYRALPMVPLVALYTLSDVIMVTPLRDGMNLIAKEYVASRLDQTGALILSEMAGASQELGESIIVNPNTVGALAQSIHEALTMPLEEQITRNSIMQNRLKRYDVLRWASDFLDSLLAFHERQAKFFSASADITPQKLVALYRKASRRLLLLDYDGTLVPSSGKPKQAVPPENLVALLQHLGNDPNTEFVLMSGRDRRWMEEWFGNLPITLVAEQGAWIRKREENWKMLHPLTSDWKEKLLPLFEMFSDRLPGSRVEEKEFAIVYHYREADPELASLRVAELTDFLVRFTANIDLQVLQESKTVEVRNAGVNKGTVAGYFLAKGPYDFILAAGDDRTDEELFRALPPDAHTIKVGLPPSHARYSMRSYVEVQKLLLALVEK